MNKANIIDIFEGLDFEEIEKNLDYNEESIRELIIDPILDALGYSKVNNIKYEKSLKYPTKIGKKQYNNLHADYAIKIGGNYAFILEAKAPNKDITKEEYIQQAYLYAVNQEIRSKYFVLCNGLRFVLYRTDNPNNSILSFDLKDIELYWDRLYSCISIDSFQTESIISYVQPKKNNAFDYLTRPQLKSLPVKKQSAKRHFGVHGYFTRQSWNVVAEYIKNFSQEGDVVLDPFGGTGVTAIEALMNNRKAINVDINPMAVFMVEALAAPVNLEELETAFNEVKTQYINHEPVTNNDIKKALSKYKNLLPKPLPLAKGSDVGNVLQLFSKKQLAELVTLKYFIKKQKNENIQKTLLLMFSGLVTRFNLTYHNSKSASTGDASAFRYYRYRIAPEPTELDFKKYLDLRFKKIIKAKKEIKDKINTETINNLINRKDTSTNLHFIETESIDYIYTDPPYGAKIPYLDLSVMWNSWLDLDVTLKDYDLEAIEGGSHNHSKKQYNNLISKSIEEMYRVLKFDRWLSFVFAHKDPEFWHLIVETAERCGFEYVGAVSQKNGQTSYKKRQNPYTVLSGELIISFRKVRSPKAILKANLGMNISEIVLQTIEGIIAKEDGATIEQINNELILKGLELGFLDLLSKEYSDITSLLSSNFDYNEKTEKYKIKSNTKFKTNIPLDLRIKYYLISYLRRTEREHKEVNFDDIVLNILPLLKNGITPNEQNVLNVLETIAERSEINGCWHLIPEDNQTTIFG